MFQKAKAYLLKAAGYFFVLLTFLIPLKYGILSVMPEMSSFYPSSLFDYLIINWPPASFGVFSSIALLMITAGYDYKNIRKTPLSLAALFCSATAVAAFYGKVISPSVFYGEAMYIHLAGVFSYVIGAYMLVSSDPVWKNRIIYALAAGTFLLTVTAFHQYFSGFDEMKKFAEMQEKQGIILSDAIRLKLTDGRVYGAMGSANLLAGYMLYAIPVLAVCAYNAAGVFEPVSLSRKIFVSTAILLGCGTLLMTKTRGAFLALGITALLWLFSSGKIRRVWKISAAAAVIMILISGAFYIRNYGRGFGSMAERLSYLRTSAVMFSEKPLQGSGWGEFFYRHMALKNTSSNESARDPHNIVASFAIHTGAAGALSVLALFLVPLFLLWKKRNELSNIDLAILWGGVAGFIHALQDINLQSPGVISALIMLLVISQRNDDHAAECKPVWRVTAAAFCLLLAVPALTCNVLFAKGDAALNHLEECCRPSVKENLYLATPQNVGRALDEVEKLRKGHPFGYTIAAAFFFARGDMQRAESLYKKAYNLDPRRPGVVSKLADIAEYNGDKAAADTLRRRAFELFPSNPEYLYP